MFSKRYKSTKVDRRTWLHVPSGKNSLVHQQSHSLIQSDLEKKV